jgi:hypothetical protein
VFRVRPAFVLPWLLFEAGCSNGPGASPAATSSPSIPSAIFATGDAGAYDPDADLGLACTDAAPSFRGAVDPILASCAGGELCHGFGSVAYAYGQLVGARSADGCDAGVLVDPGNLQRSYLLHKVTGRGMCPNSQRMPPGGALAPDKIQTITDWICSGAPND